MRHHTRVSTFSPAVFVWAKLHRVGSKVTAVAVVSLGRWLVAAALPSPASQFGLCVLCSLVLVFLHMRWTTHAHAVSPFPLPRWPADEHRSRCACHVGVRSDGLCALV